MIRRLKKFFIDLFGNIRLYSGGIVLFGDSNYKLKGNDVRDIISIVQPGDVLLNRHDHYVSGMFIKGNFSHAGLYVGGPNYSVIHVVGEGIRIEDILSFTRSDAFAVVRCSDEGLIPTAIENAYVQLNKGVQYDYDFDKDSPDEFYCSEFTDYCFGYPIRNTVSSRFIYPDDYLVSQELFKIMCKIDNK